MGLVTATLVLPVMAAEPASPPPPTESPPGVKASAPDAEGAPVPETGYTEVAEAPCPPPGAAAIPATGWFGAWKKMNMDMEEKTGTSVSIGIDEHYQYIAHGPNDGHGRDLFW